MKATELLEQAARAQIKQLIKERLDGIADYGKNKVPIGHFNAFITMKDPSKAEQIAKWARGRMEMNKELGIEHQAMEVESVDSETGVVHLRGLAWTLSNFLDSIDTSDARYDGTVSHTRPTAEEPAEAELSEDTEANFTREQVKKVVEAALMAKKLVAERELEEAFDTFEKVIGDKGSHMDPHLGLPLTQKGDEKCNKDPDCRDRVQKAKTAISQGEDFDSETGLPFSQKAMEKCKKDKGCVERAKKAYTRDDAKTTTMTKDDAKTTTTMRDRARQAGVPEDAIDKYLPNADKSDPVVDRIAADRQKMQDDHKQRMSAYKAKADKLMKKMDQIHQMAASGKIKPEQATAEYAKLQKQIKSMKI